MIRRLHFCLLLMFLALVARGADSFFLEQPLGRAEVSSALMANGCFFSPLAASNYAPVRHSEIVTLHALWLRDLSRAGFAVRLGAGAKWDVRMNCFALSWDFVSFASRRLAIEQWHSWSKATRPAIFVVCYRPDPGRPDGHAVVLFLTDEGAVFWDPQTGPVALTPAQRKTIYHPQG